MMHVETLALDLAYRRSSVNESFPCFPLLAPGFFIPHDYPLFLQQEGKKKGLSIYMRTPINQNSPKLLQQPAQGQAVGGHRKDSTPLYDGQAEPQDSQATCCEIKPDDPPGDSVVNNPPAIAADTVSVLASGQSLGVGNDNPLHYSCLGNLMDRGVWQATVHGVTKSQTQLTN